MSSSPAQPGRGYILVIAALVTLGFAAAAVVGRCIVRSRVIKSLGWDDWILMLALICSIISTGTELSSVHHGLGHHVWDLSPAQKTAASRMSAIGQGFCIMSLTFAKFTIVITFQRTIEGSGRRLAAVFLWFNGIAACVVNVVTVAIQYAQCSPVEKNYNKTIPGHCWSPDVFNDVVLAQGIISAVTDFLLALFPVVILRKLQIPLRTKLTLIILMSLGCVAGVFAIVRTAYTGPYSKQGDPTWTTVDLMTWATVERNMAIFLISVPVLPRLVPPMKHLSSQLWSLISRKTSHGSLESSAYPISKGDEAGQQSQPSSERVAPANGSSMVWKHPAELQLKQFV